MNGAPELRSSPDEPGTAPPPAVALTLAEGLKDVYKRQVLQVRLPRVLLSVLAGSSLALCGAALQGAFRNPLVGPQILGISSGAAFGGCAAILLFSSLWATLGLAFAGGLLIPWI